MLAAFPFNDDAFVETKTLIKHYTYRTGELGFLKKQAPVHFTIFCIDGIPDTTRFDEDFNYNTHFGL
jgi:hypothetical protein